MTPSPLSLSRTPLIAIVGPTASGKTSTAMALVDLLKQKGLNSEILSADSMQVYRHMDIGTAKPSPEDRKRIPHHLIDLVEPTENYNVSRYCREASLILQDLLDQGKGALVVGGTGLYVKSLIDGLNEAPAADPELRSRLETEAEALGGVVLHERLAKIDPEAAEKIHPHNIRRVVRALEVYEMSGKPFSRFHQEQSRPIWRNRFFWAGLSITLDELDRRIEQRTNSMFERGLVEEVKGLLSKGCGREHTAMQGLGYKEVAEGLALGLREMEMRDLVAQRTRRYARRQLTWWRPEKRIDWFEMSSHETAIDIASRIFKRMNPVPDEK